MTADRGRWLWRQANRAAVPLVLLWVAVYASRTIGPDDWAYWLTRDGPLYDLRYNIDVGAYLYSPVFAQAISPFTVYLTYPAFHAFLLVVQVAALVWLVGPALAAAYLLSPLGAWNVYGGNINVLLPFAVVVGFWPLVLLTKVLPGIGMAWYVGARDWSGMRRQLAMTGAIVLVSFVIAPHLWVEWMGSLYTSSQSPMKGWAIPLWLRLPVAGLLAFYAGRSGRKWLVAISCQLAMADIGWSGLSWLIAIPRLRKGDIRHEAEVVAGGRNGAGGAAPGGVEVGAHA